MLDLSNFLAQNQQYMQLGDAAAILAVINAKTISKTNSDEQSFRQLVLQFGVEFSTRILASLDAAAASNPILKATYLAVCTTGLDFSNVQVREQIDVLVTAGLWSADDAAKLKSLGVYQISPVENFFGRDQVADLAAVNTAMIVAGRKQLLTQVGAKYNALALAIQGGAISTMDEAKAFFNN